MAFKDCVNPLKYVNDGIVVKIVLARSPFVNGLKTNIVDWVELGGYELIH